MSRRKTVKIDIDVVLRLIKSVCRSNVVFCEKMGRKSGQWVSDWQRNKNFPSPEEAMRMCILLQTTPEKILLEPDDIALVNNLLEQEKGAKKAPTDKIDERVLDAALFSRLRQLTPDEVRRVDDFVQGILATHKE